MTIVGRDFETGRFDAAVKALTGGAGSVVLLTGEPGIGKSELARYAASRADQDGIRAYWGFAWEAGGAPAYWPWTQLLRSLTADLTLPDHVTAHLGTVLPEFASPEQAGLGPEQERFQLMESVRGLLSHVCTNGPVVLILEDLHAADGDTLRLLHYLARHSRTLPILFIGTFRDIEARSLPESELLWLIARDAERLEPGRLEEADIRAYLASADRSTVDDSKIRQLLKTTGGNPLFLTELVQMMAGDERVDEFGLPENVQQVIKHQLDLLPTETATFLAKASIQGREFDPESVAVCCDYVVDELSELYTPALDAQIIKPVDDGRLRFSHALHRDVIYQQLSVADRTALHLAYADLVNKEIEAGNQDRWAELARHYDAAGGTHRQQAIKAWIKAASRAQNRLAFDEAAVLYSSALRAFGSGPRFDPRERVDLLLECATADFLAGNMDKGQQQCREAFAIARTLEDAELMSEAALTWGSVFVVSRVDKDMIAALKECLERLNRDDARLRARLLARLAAALQPADDPEIPIGMAREAIELARATRDEDVLYQVLRSAISALMDFARISERLPLNQEFRDLATTRGDIAGRFRSNLRIIIDASEAGDHALMVAAIEEVDELARRIGLPHYQWRAAAVRAMQAQIEGRFERATRLVEQARSHVSMINEQEAELLLPLQSFFTASAWKTVSDESGKEICEELRNILEHSSAQTRFFILPYLSTHELWCDAQSVKRLLSDELMIERVFTGRDRLSLCMIGALALRAGDLELARRVLDASLCHADGCVSLGLMGKIWKGPVAAYLGDISLALGEAEQASEFYRRAMEISTMMQARPSIARLHLSLAESEMQLGNTTASAEHLQAGRTMSEQMQLRLKSPRPETPDEPASSSGPTLVLSQQGDIWNVQHGGALVSVRDSKGMQMLAQLVQSPEQEFHVLDLSGSDRAVASRNLGPDLDAVARAQYKSRLAELADQIEEAQQLSDVARADRLRAERDALTAELSRAFGLGGRSRRSGSDAERARVNVRRRIKDAIDRIQQQDEGIGRYLVNTIKTGRYCKYSPM